MDNGSKRAVLIWHRRAGKDKVLLNFMIERMFERVGAYYYFFPTYAQGKKILWDGIDKDGFRFIDHFPKEIIKKCNDTEMKIETVNGSVFQIIGTDKVDSIVGTNPVGAVFSEYALQDPAAWQYIRPILRENNGWAVFNFTPRGKNHGWEILEIAKKENWFWQILTVKNTGVISLAEIEEERRTGMSDDLIEQEYFCSFTGSIDGAYYGKHMKTMEDEKRLSRGLYDPTLKVSTWWDLGIDDAMAILFTQTVGKELRFIDYYENSGEGIEFYAKMLREKPYVYESHNFPHDAEVRELGTGKSRKEIALSLGIKPLNVIQRPTTKEDGIQAVRSILPRVWIDEDKCARLRDCLLSYTKEWDEKNKCFKNHPKHDWTSHGADTVQTFALGYREEVKKVNSEIPKIHYDNFGRPTFQPTLNKGLLTV